MMKKMLIGAVLLGLLVLGAGFGFASWRYNQQYQQATEFLQKGELGSARVSARAALQVAFTQRHQDEAKLLLARATLIDETLGETILRYAFESLAEIAPSSPIFADAAAERAKLMLLSQLQVSGAERLVKEALQQSPDHLAANQLLFTIYCLTNRPERADAAFWIGFRQIPVAERPTAFQQWFLSQFTRNGANRGFDLGTGLALPDREPSDDDIIKRFIAFKDSEPEEAAHYGAMASWWLWRTETKTALEILQLGQERTPSVANEVYLSSLTQALLNQGNYDQARLVLEQWPENERGFNYLRHLGVYQESTNQMDLAVVTYRKCLEIWPGPIDANVRHRLQQCLKEQGHVEEADQIVRQTEIVRSWIEERWGLVRKAIDYLHDERAVTVLLEFFTAIGKPEAVEFLTAHLAELKTKK